MEQKPARWLANLPLNLKKLDPSVTAFLILNPLAILIGLPLHFYFSSTPVSIWIFALIYAGLTNLSITAGYHRLFSHKSYEATTLAKLWFLLVGASAFQGPALKWSSDHRRHHTHEDSEKDPYNIHRGFFYAHIGWLFLKESVDQPIRALDLEKDKLVMWQHRHYLALSIVMGFGVPTLVGYFLGSAVAGFLIGGALRIFLTQQSTFFVNSLSHTLGKQTYCDKITARDSLIVAVLTHGEGYHNFHHKFQIDYRNGIRWYHWDPTKWTIKFLAWTGQAKKLKQISHFEILKARIATDALRLQKRGLPSERIDQMKEQVLQSMAKYRQLKEEYDRLRREISQASREMLEKLKIELRRAQAEFQASMRAWKASLRTPGFAT